MPRKKNTEIAEALDNAVPVREKRKLKPVINLDYVYESPNPIKKKKKIDEPEKEKEVKPVPVKKPAKLIKTASSVSSVASSDSSVDPLFLEPFKFGWIREVIYPASNDEKKIEILYYTPSGKKCRTNAEISQNLSDDLKMANFTKLKHPITNNEERYERIIRLRAEKEVKKDEKPAEKPVEKKVAEKKAKVSKTTENGGTKVEPAKIEKKPRGKGIKTEKVVAEPVPEIKSKRKIIPKLPKGATPPPTSPPRHVTASPVPVLVKKVEPTVPIVVADAKKTPQKVVINVGGVVLHVVPSGSLVSGVTSPVTMKTQIKPVTSPLTSPTVQKPVLTVNKSFMVGKRVPKDIKPVIETPVAKEVKDINGAKNSVVEASPKAKRVATKREPKRIDSSAKSSSSEVSVLPPKKRRIDTNLKGAAINRADLFGEASTIYKSLLKVFKYLPLKDMLNAATVSYMWYKVSCDDNLFPVFQLKDTRVSDLPGFLLFLKKRGCQHIILDNVRIDHFGERLPRTSLIVNQLEIHNCKNKVAELVLKLQVTGLCKVILKNITGDCDFSPMGAQPQLKELELEKITFKPDGFPIEQMRSLELLSLSTMENQKLYEEISKLSSSLLELRINKIVNRQLVSTFLLSFDKLHSLTLENVGNHANELLITVKQMRSLQKLTMLNFGVIYNFDLHLSLCLNLRELTLKPSDIQTSRPNVVNFIVVLGLFKARNFLKKFEWLMISKEKNHSKVLVEFSKMTIFENLKNLATRSSLCGADGVADSTEGEQLEEKFKNIFGLPVDASKDGIFLTGPKLCENLQENLGINDIKLTIVN